MQAKDQLQSAHHGRTVSIAARITRIFQAIVAAFRQSAGGNHGGALTRRRYTVIPLIVGTSLVALATKTIAGDTATQLEATAQITPLARIEAGAIAVTSAIERGQCTFDKGSLKVESSAEGAGEAVSTVLQPPAIGHAQLEAAIGIVEFVFTPFAAAYGAITAGHHKLTAQELAAAEQHVLEVMHNLIEGDQLRQFVVQSAPEKTHRRFVELAPEATGSSDPFSGSLETHVESLQLLPIHRNDQNYQLTIRVRARLSQAAHGQVIAERSYAYTSGEAMFIDWARAGGLESVAQTGFRQIAKDIVGDFCAPTLEAPIFLGAAYGSPSGLPARLAQMTKATAPGAPVIHFVDFHVAANGSFEVFPDASRADVLIHGPSKKHDTATDSQTDTEWAMDGLVNHRNFVVQAGACLAAVPMGIWEQTVGAFGRKSQEKLSEADGMVQRIIWKTPLQQNLADDIARTLAPQTAQPVILRKLPSISNDGSPTGDFVRISSKGAALGEQMIEMRPQTALEVHVTKVELGSAQGSQRRPSLSLDANVTLLRTSDGQELFAWPVRYSSGPRRISEWAAHDGAQVEMELRRCSRQIADAVVAQLLREGCVVPGRAPDSVLARN